jgi:hypothetical protein
MNDGGYKAFDQTLFDTYAKGYEHIIDSLKATLPRVRITAIQPSPYDDVTQPPKFEGGYNAVLLRYSEFVKELAAKDHVDTADLNDTVAADVKRAFETNPDEAKKLLPDRVHPSPAGHLLMAEELLKAWRAPALVSDIELDMGSHRIARSANATVANWHETSWTVTEQTLPMPIDWSDATTKLAVNSSDFLEALDQENLRVRGLSAGNWLLKIDDQEIGSFSSADLASGINLARYNTPMMQQALKVHGYTAKHAHVHNARWRNFQVPLDADALPAKEAALKALDDLDAEYSREQHKTAQPVAHKFVLVSQS